MLLALAAGEALLKRVCEKLCDRLELTVALGVKVPVADWESESACSW